MTASAPARVLYTIGHSNHSAEAFLALLRGHGIGRVVDGRSRPVSRWPWFGRERLAAALSEAGLDYRRLGEGLGGGPAAPELLGPSGAPDYDAMAAAPGFRAALAALLALLELPAPRHEVYNVGPGSEWTVEEWCRLLQGRYPGFRYRIAAREEEATVDFHRASLRAPLSVERLRAETGFRPRYGLEAAFADYLAWREAHRL